MRSVADGQDHCVSFPLTTQNIWDVDGRVAEINTIRSWLDNLTEWQPDLYTMTIHGSATRVTVWFKKEEHAFLCRLKWV